MSNSNSYMKIFIKGRSDTEVGNTIFKNVAFNVGDLSLGASNSFNDLTLSLKKFCPGFTRGGTIDFHVPTKDARITVFSGAKVLGKQVECSSTYNTKSLVPISKCDANLKIDSSNEVYMRVDLENTRGKLKYTLHTPLVTYEPSYSFADGKHAYKFAVSRTFLGGNKLKASFKDQSKTLSLKWSQDSHFKMAASFNLAEKQTVPKLCAEATLCVITLDFGI